MNEISTLLFANIYVAFGFKLGLKLSSKTRRRWTWVLYSV